MGTACPLPTSVTLTDSHAAWQAHVMPAALVRGLMNPRDSIEAELGMWFAFLRDTVRNSMGLVAAEVWQDVDEGVGVKLRRVAYYTDPIYEGDVEARAVLGPMPALALPGIGMAGILWDIAARNGAPPDFRLLKAMADDEDLPDDPRITASAAAFGYVGAMYMAGRHPHHTFLGGKEEDRNNGGLLLLFARETADRSLTHPANTAFFRTTATLGGALVAQAASRAKVEKARHNRSEAWRKLRTLLNSGMFLQLVRQEADKLESGEAKLKPKPKPSKLAVVRLYLRDTVRKFKGVNGAKAPKLQGPRALAAWKTCAYTFFGVLITLLCLSSLSKRTVDETDGRYFLMLGSFGALMALLFGAPNSPLAQPRNAILGCTLTGSISILFYYLSGPEFVGFLPKWLAQAFAPAAAIAISQRVNLLHPPAGAVALIFISGNAKIVDLGWMYLVLPLLAGNCLCVLVASVFNNAIPERQYPVFW